MKIELEELGLVTLWAIVCCVFLFLMMISCQPAHAEEYTDQQIVNAIYKAEGGEHAKYLYGIRSIQYHGKISAKRICYQTIRNNRKRFAQYGHKHYPSFIQFLASRYCPTTGRNLSTSEKRLNGNWIKNVRYYLAKSS